MLVCGLLFHRELREAKGQDGVQSTWILFGLTTRTTSSSEGIKTFAVLNLNEVLGNQASKYVPGGLSS